MNWCQHERESLVVSVQHVEGEDMLYPQCEECGATHGQGTRLDELVREASYMWALRRGYAED